MPTPNFQIRQVYNFDTYAPGVLGGSFKNVTVLAVMDRDTAARDVDVMALHVQVYPQLPPDSVPNSSAAYDYVKIRTSAGDETILGLAWIKPESVEIVQTRVITATIGDVGAADVSRIKSILAQNGYSTVAITITS